MSAAAVTVLGDDWLARMNESGELYRPITIEPPNLRAKS